MLRSAREIGFNAHTRTTKWHQLASTPLPFIASLRDGEFLSIMKVAEEELLVVGPGSRPANITREEFEAIWDGRLVVITRSGGLTDAGRWSRPLSHLFGRLRGWLDRDTDAVPADPAKAQTRTEATKAGDDGLGALMMLLRCHGVAAELRTNSTSMRDGEDRRHRDAALCEGARAEGACACHELGTSLKFPATRGSRRCVTADISSWARSLKIRFSFSTRCRRAPKQ